MAVLGAVRASLERRRCWKSWVFKSSLKVERDAWLVTIVWVSVLVQVAGVLSIRVRLFMSHYVYTAGRNILFFYFLAASMHPLDPNLTS